jgi:dTDP-4-dehydrorhamnose 3,5-epimerase
MNIADATNVVHGVLRLENEALTDERGFTQEIYASHSYPHLIGKERQVVYSFSKAGSVRGLLVTQFSRVCTCLSGRIFDVVVDMRETSPSYKKWEGNWLTKGQQIFIPAGCAHGFLALEDSTFLYIQDGLHGSAVEYQVDWQDPQIGIVWPHCKRYIMAEPKNLLL